MCNRLCGCWSIGLVGMFVPVLIPGVAHCQDPLPLSLQLFPKACLIRLLNSLDDPLRHVEGLAPCLSRDGISKVCRVRGTVAHVTEVSKSFDIRTRQKPCTGKLFE